MNKKYTWVMKSFCHFKLINDYLRSTVSLWSISQTLPSMFTLLVTSARIVSRDDCCSRWYFTFNGAECSSPGSIVGIVYMGIGKKQNLHRTGHIEGHCDNIHKGKVRVGFWVGSCNNGSKNVPDLHWRGPKGSAVNTFHVISWSF